MTIESYQKVGMKAQPGLLLVRPHEGFHMSKYATTLEGLLLYRVPAQDQSLQHVQKALMKQCRRSGVLRHAYIPHNKRRRSRLVEFSTTEEVNEKRLSVIEPISRYTTRMHR